MEAESNYTDKIGHFIVKELFFTKGNPIDLTDCIVILFNDIQK